MPDPNSQQIEQLLRAHGLSDLLPVHWVARRPGCIVLGARLLTASGDADAQVQLYNFRDEPEAIVDFEEEITLLTSGSGSGRALAQEVRDQEWGILITCMAEDSAILERFFNEPEAERPAITYHSQLDRILGGDYFHQLQEKWLKACLASVERALQIRDLLDQARKAYERAPGWPGKLDSPLPRLLAILQIPAIPLEGAPASYRELALIQSVIDSPEVLEMVPAEGETELATYARQLFKFLRSQHRSGICFSRDAGCCLRPEFLLRSGALTDAYFIARPESPALLERSRERDLWNALMVMCEMAKGDARIAGVALSQAITSYTGKTKLSKEVDALVQNAAEKFVTGNPKALESLLTTEIMHFRV